MVVQHTAGGTSTWEEPLVDERCRVELEPGDYAVAVIQRGGIPARVPVTVHEGHNEVTLTRAPTSLLLVRVVDGTGVGIRGAQVMTGTWNEADVPPTDARGEVRFAVVVGAPLTLTVSATGFAAVKVPVSARELKVEVVLSRVPMLRGRVVRANGASVTRFTVDGRVVEALDGRFEELTPVHEPGSSLTVSLTIRAPGLVEHRRDVEVPEEGDLDLGDIVLERGHTIRGRVVDRDDLEALAGATVWGAGVTTQSDAQGRFALEGQPERAVLVARHPSRVPALVTARPNVETLVTLARGVTVSGRVTQANARSVVAIGETVEVAKVAEDRTFRFEALSRGAWRFSASFFDQAPHIVFGPLERQSLFVKTSLKSEAGLDLVIDGGVVDLVLE